MCTGGYYQTGITAILKACEMPKGSFYNYFESKEHFTLEAIRLYAEQLFDQLEELENRKDLNGAEKIEAYFAQVAESYRKTDFKTSCLLANLSLELGNLHPGITAEISAVRLKIEKRLTGFLVTAWPAENTLLLQKKTALLMDAFYGALTRMRTGSTDAPLTDFFDYHLPLILNTVKN